MPVKKLKTENLKPKTAKVASLVVKKTATKTVGLSVPVFGLTGTKKGTVILPKEVFGAKINNELMAQAVRVYSVNQRQGTASTKSRGDINKTKAKWYRQKGTGRARHGAKSAPIFVGGGVALGPRPRNFELKMSQQMRRKALISALTSKLSEDRIRVVDLAGATGKTNELIKLFRTLELMNKKNEGKILMVGATIEGKRAVRNIEAIEVYPASSINTYSVLNNKYIVFEKSAIEEIGKQTINK